MGHMLVSVLVVGLLLGVSAPEPNLTPCPPNGARLAVFDAADRAALLRHIPGLANAPEVASDADPILVNGIPAGLSRGPLHVRVFRCFRYNEIPIIGGFWDGPRPAMVRNVVVIATATSEESWYTDVNLEGLSP